MTHTPIILCHSIFQKRRVRRPHGFSWMICLVLALSFLSACDRRPPANVLLITVDTLRADHLKCYGYGLGHTPNMDRLASEGVLCKDAISAAPITMPSHATILTGVYPPAHGVRDNGAYALGNDSVTLAERLKTAGFTTQAFVSALVLNRRYNLTQGFDGYDDNLWGEADPKLFMIRDRRGAKTASRFLDWLKNWSATSTHSRFFVWVHLFDPHAPYDPPYIDRILAPSLYDGEISAADRAIGSMIKSLQEQHVLDDTLIILTADHGESLDEHQEKTHAIFIYDATVHVPLIIRYPRLLPRGKVYEGPVRTVDIVPTVLGILGLPGGAETQGADLLPALQGKIPAPDLPQYSESLLSEVGFGMAPLYGVRMGRYKYILAPKPEIYDLGNDPKELHNLYSQQNRLAGMLDRELQRITEQSRLYKTEAGSNPMTGETMEMLRSLGYLAGSQEVKSMGGMDPKDGITIYNKLEDARHFAQQENWEASEKVLRGILEQLPAHLSARNILALVLLRQDKLQAAEEQYLLSLSTDPNQFRVYGMLGSMALKERDLDEAERNYRKALEITPTFVEATCNLGFIELLRGHQAEAEKLYRKAIAGDPGYPRVYRRFADLYYEREDYGPALDYYQKALENLPNDFQALIQAGNCARRLGDSGKSADFYLKAGETQPDSWIPAYNLACLAAVKGEEEKAVGLLQQAVTKGLRNLKLLESDGDLATVRKLSSFQILIRELQQLS
jgi:choline-sulfatase